MVEVKLVDTILIQHLHFSQLGPHFSGPFAPAAAEYKINKWNLTCIVQSLPWWRARSEAHHREVAGFDHSWELARPSFSNEAAD